MSLSMLKSIRDGGLVGGVTTGVTLLLTHYGLDQGSALIAGTICGGLAARVYRYLRAQNNAVGAFLTSIDPPAEANSLS